MTRSLWRWWAVAVLCCVTGNGQIVFSRRVYQTRGSSYSQVWEWNASNGTLKQLTHVLRDHDQPRCSEDGKQILFRRATADHKTAIWAVDRATGEERELIGDWSPHEWSVVTESRGDPTERLRFYHRLAVFGSVDEAAVSADRSRAAMVGEDGQLVVVNLLSGESAGIGNCRGPAWSPDGNEIACVDGQDVIGFDTATRRGAWRAQVAGDPGLYLAGVQDWQDGRLLVARVGKNHTSTSPQSDYFAYDLKAKTWRPAGTGNEAQWLPGRNAVMYSTPRDLVPLTSGSEHGVWSAQLAVFDLDTQQQKLMTSGVTDNTQPSVCAARPH